MVAYVALIGGHLWFVQGRARGFVRGQDKQLSGGLRNFPMAPRWTGPKGDPAHGRSR